MCLLTICMLRPHVASSPSHGHIPFERNNRDSPKLSFVRDLFAEPLIVPAHPVSQVFREDLICIKVLGQSRPEGFRIS